ncbi:hypothetical protein GCM10009789_58280 [Kribbella sancticallisti]|uniref:Fibronectin type-III domain-containing protein n=1 Tax=Kribbella sancticallisti TaxID=460087 RepID=A0ABN2E4Z2_9ACTN
MKLAWADETRQAVRVTWKDSGTPNRLTIEGVLSTNPSFVKYVGADDPDSADIPSSAFPPDGTYKIAVGVGTSTGGLTSRLVRSEVFDTNGPVRPSAATATPVGKDVLMRWTVPVVPQDFTPNDPLDVTGKIQYYVPVVGLPGEPLRAAGPATTSKRQVIKNLTPPYLFQLRAENEWTSTIGGQISARTTSTTAAIPGLAQFSVPVRIRGRTILQEVVCAPEGSCVQQRATSAGLPVVLLTQVTPGARWTPAARGTTTSGGHFEVTVVTGGTRPYKAVSPLYSRVGVLSSESSSKPQLTKSVVRVQSAGFVGGGMKKRNENATLVLLVKPAMTANAMLQVWNRQAKAWSNVKAVPIRRGQASITFKAAQLGVFVYRFVLPSAVLLGRPLYPTNSHNLILSVRP